MINELFFLILSKLSDSLENCYETSNSKRKVWMKGLQKNEMIFWLIEWWLIG